MAVAASPHSALDPGQRPVAPAEDAASGAARPNTFARNSALNAIGSLCTTLGGFLSSILVARLFGVDGTGVVAFAIWTTTVAVMLADLGVPGALARFLPELRTRRAHDAAIGLVRFVTKPFLAAAVATMLCFFFYGLWLWRRSPAELWLTPDNFRTAPLFWFLVGLACLAQAMAGYLNGYLKGTQNFRRMALVAGASATLQLGFVLVGGLTFGIAGALTGAIAVGILPAVLLRGLVRGGATVAPELKRRVVRFAWQAWAAYLVNAFAWSRMEIFFLERSWGSEAVGLFAVGLTMANLASQGPMMLTGALLPYLSQHVGTASAHKAREAYAAGMRVLAAIVFPACLGLAAIAPVLLPAIYGPAFARSVPVATVLVCAAAFSATTSVAFTYMLAMERSRFVFMMGALGAILSIIAGFTIVPAFGPLAAAAARGGIQLCVAAAIVWYVVRRLDTPTPFASLSRLLGAALLSALAAGACLHLIAAPASLALILAVASGVIVYALAVRLLRALPRGDADRLASAATMLPTPVRAAAVAAFRFLSPADETGHGKGHAHRLRREGTNADL